MLTAAFPVVYQRKVQRHIQALHCYGSPISLQRGMSECSPCLVQLLGRPFQLQTEQSAACPSDVGLTSWDSRLAQPPEACKYRSNAQGKASHWVQQCCASAGKPIAAGNPSHQQVQAVTCICLLAVLTMHFAATLKLSYGCFCPRQCLPALALRVCCCCSTLGHQAVYVAVLKTAIEPTSGKQLQPRRTE